MSVVASKFGSVPNCGLLFCTLTRIFLYLRFVNNFTRAFLYTDTERSIMVEGRLYESVLLGIEVY